MTEPTETETEVWKHLCNRQQFMVQDWASLPSQKGLKPGDLGYRKIRGSLINAIVASNLFDEPQFELIHIEGATIEGPMILSNEVIRSNLALIYCNFISDDVNLDNLISAHDLDFTGTTFRNGFHAENMRIGGSVKLGSGADDPPRAQRFQVNDINLAKSVIGGDVTITNAYAAASIDLHASKVAGGVDLRNSAVHDIDLASGDFGQIEAVHLQSSSLIADHATVHQSVFLDRSSIGDISLSGSAVHGNVSFRGLTLTKLDLTDARIDRDLQFGPTTDPDQQAPPPPTVLMIQTKWVGDSLLQLDHASIGFLQAPPPVVNAARGNNAPPSPKDAATPSESAPVSDNWPKHVQLNGLTFTALNRELQPVGVQLIGDEREWTAEEMLAWLGLSTPFSASVYQFVSDYYSKVGLIDAARMIGYSKRNVELRAACSSFRVVDCASLTFSYLTIGYGYYMWRSLAWIIALTAIGACAFALDAPHVLPPAISVSPIAYSFDMLLPVIRLRELHYGIDLNSNWARLYFYMQKILGFALGSFVVAGISGLAH